MTREAAVEAIERLGGKVTASVSRKTSALVVGRRPWQQAGEGEGAWASPSSMSRSSWTL